MSEVEAGLREKLARAKEAGRGTMLAGDEVEHVLALLAGDQDVANELAHAEATCVELRAEIERLQGQLEWHQGVKSPRKGV